MLNTESLGETAFFPWFFRFGGNHMRFDKMKEWRQREPAPEMNK
jgi:hypothetical protein